MQSETQNEVWQTSLLPMPSGFDSRRRYQFTHRWNGAMVALVTHGGSSQFRDRTERMTDDVKINPEQTVSAEVRRVLLRAGGSSAKGRPIRSRTADSTNASPVPVGKIKHSKNHPWKRVQTDWAFDAWARRNPELNKTIEARFEKQATR